MNQHTNDDDNDDDDDDDDDGDDVDDDDDDDDEEEEEHEDENEDDDDDYCYYIMLRNDAREPRILKSPLCVLLGICLPACFGCTVLRRLSCWNPCVLRNRFSTRHTLANSLKESCVCHGELQ